MADKVSIQTRFAQAWRDFKQDFVPRVAELSRPVLGNVNVSKDEAQQRWWQEAEGWTPEQEMALLSKGMTPEDVGLLKYPNREIDAKAGGRANDDRAQALYARDMSAAGPPTPGPLEQAAKTVEQPPMPQATPMSLPAPIAQSAALPAQPMPNGTAGGY